MPPQGGYSLPQTYTQPSYTYSTSYNPNVAFIAPTGVNPQIAAKMMQASAIFRTYDRDRSGSLNKKEWKKAMKAIGYHFGKGEGKRVFKMIDRDHSKKISEREFCEFYCSTR